MISCCVSAEKATLCAKCKQPLCSQRQLVVSPDVVSCKAAISAECADTLGECAGPFERVAGDTCAKLDGSTLGLLEGDGSVGNAGLCCMPSVIEHECASDNLTRVQVQAELEIMLADNSLSDLWVQSDVSVAPDDVRLDDNPHTCRSACFDVELQCDAAIAIQSQLRAFRATRRYRSHLDLYRTCACDPELAPHLGSDGPLGFGSN